MDAVPSQRLTALIDEESLLICRFGFLKYFRNIHKVYGTYFGQEFNLPIAVTGPGWPGFHVEDQRL